MAKFLKLRWQKITAAISLFLIAIILTGAFFINRYWEPILTSKLKNAVDKGTKGLYHINFDDIRLHVLQGRTVFYNISLKLDTSVYRQLLKAHMAPDNIYSLHAKKLVLKHIHPFSLYFDHKLDIGDVILSAPEINITHSVGPKKDTVKKKNQTIYQQISKSLKMIHIGNVLFNDVALRYENYKGGKISISKFKELNLGATDLLIDSATQFDKSRFLYCRDITAELYNYSGSPLNGLYNYKIKLVKFSTRTSKLGIYGFTFIPNTPPFEFFRKLKTDRFTARIDSLELNNFDYNVYSRTNTITASSMDINHAHLIVFGNPIITPEKLTTDKIRSFPNEAIHLVPTSFKIDTLLLHKLAVTYQEFNTKTKQTGHLDFTNIRGRAYNITNDSVALKKNNHTRLKISALFMNEAPLEVNFNFNLTDKLRSYSYFGTLGGTDMQIANPACVPLSSVAIKSGYLNRMDFDFNADKNITTGHVKVLYSDLKIQVLKADTAKAKMHRNLLATLYANAMVIKHNNPDTPGDAPRTGKVAFKRPFYFPFFKTIWTALFNGIKPCVGVDEKTQRETSHKMAEHEIKKQERQRKHALRKLLKERKKQLKKALKRAGKQKN